MAQKTVKTGFERPIRYSVKLENDDDDYYSWQWEDDDKLWINYSPTNVLDFEKEFNTPNTTSFDLKITDKLSYEVNFSQMKQINKKTKFSRSIKRVKSGKLVL
jgi:hypothetical protein